MANHFAAIFVIALAAASALGVQSNGFGSLKNRFSGGNFLRRSYRDQPSAMRPVYPTTGYIPSSPYGQHVPYKQDGGAAAAAAAASGSGPGGRSAAATASAAPGAVSSSASLTGGRGFGTPRTTGYNREYNYGDARNDYTVNGAPVSGGYDYEPEYTAPAPVAPPKPMKPVKPVMNFETFKAPIYESYKARPVYDNGYRSGGTAAAAAAAAGGNAAAAAAATGGRANVRYNPDGYESNYAAQTGAYTGDMSGYESSGYKRGTEHLIDHEEGHKDDNHEYRAQSFGKNDNESKKEKYKKKHKDLEVTPTVYRLSKSSEEYEGDYKKDGSESGSSVMAKDKSSSGFKKDSNKFVETVDKFHNRNGNDIMANTDRHSVHRVNNEDEEYYDTDGIYPGAPVGMSGGGGAAAAAAAAGGYGSAAAAAAAAGH